MILVLKNRLGIHGEGTPFDELKWIQGQTEEKENSVQPESMMGFIDNDPIKYGGGKPIRVSVRKDGKHALLLVRDQGPGISPKDQMKIFQRFERAVTDNQTKGLGLGLYIVQQIVEQHGGQIDVESELGQGTTFLVLLPITAKYS